MKECRLSSIHTGPHHHMAALERERGDVRCGGCDDGV